MNPELRIFHRNNKTPCDIAWEPKEGVQIKVTPDWQVIPVYKYRCDNPLQGSLFGCQNCVFWDLGKQHPRSVPLSEVDNQPNMEIIG